MQVEVLPLDALHVDVSNVRRHPARNLDAIKASLARFGLQKPIVIDANNVVRAGNGTLEAARALGWETIACVRTPLRGVEAVGYAIADNRSAELAEWDDAGLAEVLRGLQSEPDFDLAAVGFSDDEVSELLDSVADDLIDPGEAPEPQTERAEELREEWGTERGQLWVIPSATMSGAEHRLLCGDSTSPEDVRRVMGGETARLMNTDPPYGINNEEAIAARNEAKNATAGTDTEFRSWDAIANDDLTGEHLQAFLESAIRVAIPHLAPDAAFYLWHPMLTQGTFFAAAAAAADILIHRQIIWVKPHFIFGRGDYHWRHELCFYGWVRGNRPPFYGERNQDTVWVLDEGGGSIRKDQGHPTQKPVELFARPIRNHTRRGDIVYEPFAGSGSQFCAAELAGRLCRGLEIAPKYVAVALQRLADTGLEPRLA
jgi:DNA modification methylase